MKPAIIKVVMEFEIRVPEETKYPPTTEEDSKNLKRIEDEIIDGINLTVHSGSICAVKDLPAGGTVPKKKKKREFAHHVPRYHTHVYKVEGKMVEVDWLNVEMSNAETRDLAIELVKKGDNVNPAIKSDCEYIAVSFKLLE